MFRSLHFVFNSEATVFNPWNHGSPQISPYTSPPNLVFDSGLSKFLRKLGGKICGRPAFTKMKDPRLLVYFTRPRLKHGRASASNTSCSQMRTWRVQSHKSSETGFFIYKYVKSGWENVRRSCRKSLILPLLCNILPKNCQYRGKIVSLFNHLRGMMWHDVHCCNPPPLAVTPPPIPCQTSGTLSLSTSFATSGPCLRSACKRTSSLLRLHHMMVQYLSAVDDIHHSLQEVMRPHTVLLPSCCWCWSILQVKRMLRLK